MKQFLRHLTYWECQELLHNHPDGKLAMDDLPSLPSHSRYLSLRQQQASIFSLASVDGGSSAPLYAFFSAFFSSPPGRRFLVAGLVKILQDLCGLSIPWLMSKLITVIEVQEETDTLDANRWIYGVGLLIIPILQSLILQNYFLRVFTSHVEVQSICFATVFNALLKRDLSALHTGKFTTAINPVSLLSADATHVADALPYLHNIWSCPLQLAIYLAMLASFVGAWPALCAVAICIFMLGIQRITSSVLEKAKSRALKRVDQRVTITEEVVTCMKGIKMRGWEIYVHGIITRLRALELKALKVVITAETISVVSGWYFSPLAVAVGTVALLAYSNRAEAHALKPSVIFPALAIIANLAFPLSVFVWVAFNLVSMRVSLRRISEYVSQPITPVDLRGEGVNSADVHAINTSGKETVPLRQRPCSLPTVSPQIAPGTVVLASAAVGWPRRGPPASAGAAPASPAVPPDEGMTTILRDVYFSAAAGQFVVVTGPLGSGKTLLFLALCGEAGVSMTPPTVPAPNLLPTAVKKAVPGVFLGGRVSLCPGTAWIFTGTIRNNILCRMGRVEHDPFPLPEPLPSTGGSFLALPPPPSDPAHWTAVPLREYVDALQSSALFDDLAEIAGGDAAHLGERGVTLSGGQKARLALARAFTNCPDVMLLDDVCSALDARVGKFVVDELIRKAHKDNVCVVLFTHNVAAAHRADVLYELSSNGRVQLVRYRAQDSADSKLHVSPTNGGSSSESDVKWKPVEATEALHTEEHVDATPVSYGAMGKYLKFQGKVLFLLPFLYIAGAVMMIWKDITLSRWAAESTVRVQHLTPSAAFSMNGTPSAISTISEDTAWSATSLWLSQYILLTCIGAVVVLLRTFFTFLGALNASTKLHDSMVKALFFAPVQFFERTPLGRILNRVSSDIQTLDETMRTTEEQLFSCGMEFVQTMVVVALYFRPMIAVFLIIAPIYVWTQRTYRLVQRAVTRTASALRSPLYAFATDVSGGIPTIRAGGLLGHVQAEFAVRVDSFCRAEYSSMLMNRWLSLRVECIGGLFVGFSAIFACIFSPIGPSTGVFSLSSATIGLVLAYVSAFTNDFGWFTRQSALIEMQATSVTRVLEFANVPPEVETAVKTFSLDIEDAECGGQVIEQPKKSVSSNTSRSIFHDDEHDGERMLTVKGWSSAGKASLVFDSVYMRYAPHLPYALNGVSFSLPPGSFTGIVGRTGAGKSSIVATLCRLVASEGNIIVDGVSIRDLPLKVLRSSICVVPQDPVIFSGTVLGNILFPRDETLSSCFRDARLSSLDNYSVVGDADCPFSVVDVQPQPPATVVNAISKLLEDVGMVDPVQFLARNTGKKGAALSSGEAQVVCMLRALTHACKIIVLDEATAGVDPVADAAIQTLLSRYRGTVTIVAIAHRISTVMGADFIVAMKAGNVAEFGSPSELLAIPNGIYSGLAAASSHSAGDSDL